MRSKILCSIVLLTSLIWHASEGNGGPPPPPSPLFCKDTPATDGFCKDQDISLADLAWKFENAFNEWKPEFTWGSEKHSVVVDSNRALYMSAEQTPLPNPLTFIPVNIDQCKNVASFTEGAAEASRLTINQASKYEVQSLAKPTVLAVLDPECRLYITSTDLANVKYKHVFAKNFKAESLPELFWKLPSGQTGVDLQLGSYVIAQRGEKEGDVSAVIKAKNAFFRFNENEEKTKSFRMECKHQCKYGTIFEFRTVKGIAFAHTFKMIKSCSWMSITLNENAVTAGATAEISLRHGFVTLPNEVQAYPMDFDAPGDDVYAVSVFYHVDSNKKSKLIIANARGQAIRSYKSIDSDASVFFSFSQNDCLAEPIGPVMTEECQGANKAEYKKTAFLPVHNLGYIVGQYNSYNAYRYAKTMEPAAVKYEEGKCASNNNVVCECDVAKLAKIDKKDIIEKEGSYKPPELFTTTLPPTVDPNFTDPPAPEVVIHVLTADEVTKIEEGRQLAEARRKEIADALLTKSYYTWAIPAGFAAGSFASFIICNLILFVMRRTVCTFWYKAMYKRYGSDTTMGAGTTMGKTGAGETVGGGTTAGGTTMGGETGSTTAA